LVENGNVTLPLSEVTVVPISLLVVVADEETEPPDKRGDVTASANDENTPAIAVATPTTSRSDAALA
jgi:hypothetical protein